MTEVEGDVVERGQHRGISDTRVGPSLSKKGTLMTRMLVPTDFSEASLAAVRCAVDLMYSVRGEMLLLHVIEGDPVRRYVVRGLSEPPSVSVDSTGNIFSWPLPQEIIRHDLYEEAQWKLSALLPSAFHGRFRSMVVVGKAANEIVRIAREQKADLIVMGTRGRGGLRHLLRRSVAD
jgi:universal stress protein A